jgi:hypothetical protein
MVRMKNEISKLQKIQTNVSIALIMQKLKVTREVAEDLCLKFWYTTAKDCFYMRNFGVNTEGFLRGDFLDNPNK